MIDMTLDTHAFVKTLTAAGMPEPQAEAVTTLVTAAHEAGTARFVTKADLTDLATKSDIAALESGLRECTTSIAACATKSELAAVESSLRLALAETKADIQKWMFGLVGGAVVLNAVTVIGGMLALLRIAAH